MRKTLTALVLAAILIPGLASASTWQTSYGPMKSKFNDNGTFMGTYDSYPGGFIFLEHQGNGLYRGYWSQTNSEVRCQTRKRGRGYAMSDHWGRLEVQSTGDGQSFKGKWSYCNKRPSQGWDGHMN